MTLEQLRIFLEVAKHEHVTRAAGILNLTQSSVSASLQALEERHQVHLFERVGRRIVLTDAGKKFVPVAEAVLASARIAEQSLDDLSATARGRLVVYSSQTIATQWLPKHLVAFRSTFGGVRIEVHIGNTEQCVEAMQAGHCDLAFIEAKGAKHNLEEIAVGADRITLVVNPQHAWANTPPKSLQALSQSQWILREKGSGTRKTFEDALNSAGGIAQKLDVVLELPSNEAVCAATSAGCFATVVSASVAQPYLETGRLVAIDLPISERPFYMLRNPNRRSTHAITALEAMILRDQ